MGLNPHRGPPRGFLEQKIVADQVSGHPLGAKNLGEGNPPHPGFGPQKNVVIFFLQNGDVWDQTDATLPGNIFGRVSILLLVSP